jgi:NAD-dependent deacetylase
VTAADDAPDGALDSIAAWLRAAEHLVVLTGAGISTESGIPDFRGPQGVWTKNPAAEKTATLQHYVGSRDVRVQAWRNRVEGNYFGAEPNDGHRALVAIEHRLGAAFDTLVTQNVDRLHHDAGSDPERIIEIHGNVREVKCLDCTWRAPMAVALDRVRAGESDPECPECGGILKSATISFGENLVVTDLERAQEAALRADVFLALGTSLGVYPAAALPELALRRGARLIVFNAQETPFDDHADAVSRSPLGTILPALAERLR